MQEESVSCGSDVLARAWRQIRETGRVCVCTMLSRDLTSYKMTARANRFFHSEKVQCIFLRLVICSMLACMHGNDLTEQSVVWGNNKTELFQCVKLSQSCTSFYLTSVTPVCNSSHYSRDGAWWLFLIYRLYNCTALNSLSTRFLKSS